METAFVLLAAGDSRRFHGNKLLHPLDGKPMYRYLPDRLESIDFPRKLVVTQYEEIMEDLGRRGYQVVENKESHLGISHSIHLALDALEQWEQQNGREKLAVCFAVGDQPYLQKETVEAFLAAWRKSGKGMGCLCYNGQPGNPAVFAPEYREELYRLTKDTGGRRVMKAHPEEVYLHEIEDGRELEDIDERG